jgi:hypothetical protein
MWWLLWTSGERNLLGCGWWKAQPRRLGRGQQAIRESLLKPGRRQHAAHESLISSEIVADVPLTGLFFIFAREAARVGSVAGRSVVTLAEVR